MNKCWACNDTGYVPRAQNNGLYEEVVCDCRQSTEISRDTVPDGTEVSKKMMILYLEDNVEQIFKYPDSFGSPDQQELLFVFCLKTLIWLKTAQETGWVLPIIERFCKNKKMLSNVTLCDQLKQWEFIPALKEIYLDYQKSY